MVMAKVALCIIATNNYVDFVGPLTNSADKYFLLGHDVTYHLFTNGPLMESTQPFYRSLHSHLIQHEHWPYITLKRYHYILSTDLSTYDYVYYIDADSLFVAPVGDEILQDMIVVSHPGYYAKGGGSWETNGQSFAFTPIRLRDKYVCGGFQGGANFMWYANEMKSDIDHDLQNGIIAKWHDESHLNSMYADKPYNFTLFDCSYMMPESIDKRKAWHINHIEPKILALEKDHKNYQK